LKKIRVNLKKRSYDIIIGRGVLNRLGLFVKKLKLGRDAVIITNSTVLRLYGNKIESVLKLAGLSVLTLTVPDSEESKSLKTASGILEKIARYDRNKKIFIVAFGGGVVGDLAGFVSAVYKRGVPYIQIPTTLLAQVDSAIGGKTAVDLPIAKNLIGAIYQPRLVLSDTALLKTLPGRQIRNALAEIIKYGAIKDAKLLSFIDRNMKKLLSNDIRSLEYVIELSSAIKTSFVEKDEFDKTGHRALLNYGHTIGHAIEASSGYSGRYTHGEAIAIGMIAAADISSRLGVLKDSGYSQNLRRMILACGLPVKAKGLKARNIYESHLRDKKFTNARNRFVLPIGPGRVKVVQGVPDIVIKKAISEILAR